MIYVIDDKEFGEELNKALTRISEIKKLQADLKSEAQELRQWVATSLNVRNDGKSMRFSTGEREFTVRIPKNETVDGQMLRLLAKENGLESEVDVLFKCKYERIKGAWGNLDLQKAEILSGAIKIKDGLPEVEVAGA